MFTKVTLLMFTTTDVDFSHYCTDVNNENISQYYYYYTNNKNNNNNKNTDD